jgi:hypothetical protein
MGRKNKVEGSIRGDENNRGEEKKANALALKRMELQKMEEEIDRRKKELDERLAGLGMTQSTMTDGGVSDGNQSVTYSMASRRRRLEADEAEILARNKELDEITEGLIRSRGADKVHEHATESIKVEKVDRISPAALDHCQQQEQVGPNEKDLQEKEAIIATKSKRLEEASRLNLEKELEIRERMAALDAVSNYAHHLFVNRYSALFVFCPCH